MPDPEARNVIKKETLVHVFSREFCKIFKNNFFIERNLKAAPMFDRAQQKIIKATFSFTEFVLACKK